MSALDFESRYTVDGYRGVAFYLLGYAHERVDVWDAYAGEHVEEDIVDTSRVRAVMVGDDRVHILEVDDLIELAEDDYCHECGQIGCGGDGR